MNNYLEINKDAWNKRTKVHVDSDFYDNATFLKGRNSLNSIELNLFNSLEGKTVLHLQCHFGQDSLSLARLGAKVTGVDLSEEAIKTARELNEKLNLDVNFICADVYACLEQLEQQFDYVFTSYGTIGWLPDINKWANIVSKALKPGGTFIFAEFHPFIWTMDSKLEKIDYSYFKSDAIIDTTEGTYTDKDAPISYQEVSWNHGLGEVFKALQAAGITIEDFNEYDYSPYNCFSNLIEIEKGKFQFEQFKGMIPMVYSIKGKKIR